MSIEQIEINTTEYLVTLQDGSNLQTLEITEGVQLDVFLSEMGLQGPPGPAGTGSVSSVGISVPTGLTVSNSPVTDSGVIDIAYQSGYSIPTTASQSNWDVAYGWGDHALAGYLTNAAIGSTVQAYDADLTSWAAISPSSKQDTLVSGSNIKTINSTSLLGSGNVVTGDVTLTDTQTLTNKTLSGAVLNDGYTEEVFAVTTDFFGNTSLSPTKGSIQTWTLTGNATPTAGTWASGQSMTLMVDDGSAYTINWASMSVTWKTNGGTAPTLLTSGYTVITLWKVGTTLYGARVGDA